MSQSYASRLRQVVRANPAVIVPKLRLPGDTAETVRALHALNQAGLLELNVYAADARTMPCPRCGRQTAVWGWRLASVCTGCRAEYHRAHVTKLPSRPRLGVTGVGHGRGGTYAVMNRPALVPESCKGPGCKAVLPAGGEYCQACGLLGRMRERGEL